MKVYILNTRDIDGEFLTVKKVHFTEPNRESTRQHIQRESGMHHIWFEDEEPPPQLLKLLEESEEEDAETS